MNRSKNIWNKNILIFMFGILVAIGIAFPLANESVSYKEVPTSKLVRYGHGWEHIENNKQSIYIQKDNAEIKYYFEGKMEDWFYREFYISGLYSYENIVAEVCFYDESGNEIARSVEYWGNGRNIVSNPVGNYRFIIIRFYHQENASFIMEGMRLLKTLPQVHKKKMLLYFIIIFSIYIMLFYTLAKQKKIRSISKKIFSEIYSCEKDLYKVLNKIKMRKNSSIERIILWGILILLIAGAEYRLQIGSKYIIRYLELFIFAGTILLGRSYFNLYEKNIEVDENKRIFYFLNIMAIWLLLSDFFVTKKIKFAGIILVVSIGYLIYQILYRSCKEEALKEFIIGYIVAIIIMIIFRTYMKINGIWRITEPYNLQELFGVWKGYITHLNLLGHRNILFLNGRRVFPFNGMLKIGYRYGTPAIFFYLIGWIMFLKIAVESFLKKDTKKNSWMICLVIIFLCNMMLNII